MASAQKMAVILIITIITILSTVGRKHRSSLQGEEPVILGNPMSI